jgi:hypothetical protein
VATVASALLFSDPRDRTDVGWDRAVFVQALREALSADPQQPPVDETAAGPEQAKTAISQR